MAKIQVMDFLKNVELNRRRLIQNCHDKGQSVADTASLTDVVSANNNITYDDSKCEVRFFDGDATNIHTAHVDKHSSVIPPQNPHLDDKYLTFDHWMSALGDNNFDNIVADLDFGAIYKFNETDLCCVMFITVNETTGFDISFTLHGYRLTSIASVDWGDNTEVITYTGSGSSAYGWSPSHTYAQYGEYVVKVYVENRSETQSQYSHQFVLQSVSIPSAMTKLYCDVCTSSITQTSVNLSTLVITDTIINVTGVATPRPCAIPYYICKTSIPYGFGSTGYSTSDSTLDERDTPLKVIIVQDSATMYNVILDKYTGKFTNIKHSTIYKLVDYNDLQSQQTTIGEAVINKYIYPHERKYISSFAYCSLPDDFNLPIGLLNIPTFGTSTINYLSIPSTVISMTNDSALNLYSLQNVDVYSNFALNLNLSNAKGLTKQTLLNFLNNFADLTTLPSCTLTLHQNAKNKCDYSTVKLFNNIWQYCSPSEEGAMLMSQAFANKNWIIA